MHKELPYAVNGCSLPVYRGFAKRWKITGKEAELLSLMDDGGTASEERCRYGLFMIEWRKI